MWKGYHLSIESIRKGYLFVKNGILKGKGLDLGAEPPRINICWVPPPPPHHSVHLNWGHLFSKELFEVNITWRLVHAWNPLPSLRERSPFWASEASRACERLLSRASRASTVHDIPQTESLLEGYSFHIIWIPVRTQSSFICLQLWYITVFLSATFDPAYNYKRRLWESRQCRRRHQ